MVAPKLGTARCLVCPAILSFLSANTLSVPLHATQQVWLTATISGSNGRKRGGAEAVDAGIGLYPEPNAYVAARHESDRSPGGASVCRASWRLSGKMGRRIRRLTEATR